MKRIFVAIALTGVAWSCMADGGRHSVAPSGVSDTVAVVEAIQPEEPVEMTFAFGGDVMMGTTYPKEQLTADDGKSIFQDVAPILRGADVAAVNLEGVLLDGYGDPKKCVDSTKCFTFKMPERYASLLVDAGIDFVSIANNHAGDFGVPGMSSTRRVLTDAGIKFAGQRGICPTAVIERSGKKIGFAAFGHSDGTLSIMDYDEVKRVVAGLDSVCDIVVVSFHGGAEGSRYNHVPDSMEMFLGGRRGDVRKFARTAVDAGADIVYGHGPHVTRALEIYNDRLIMYSLGNFATPYGMNLSGINSHAPVVTVVTGPDGVFRSGRIHPFVQHKGVGPRHDKSGAVIHNIRNLTSTDCHSSPVTISVDGTIGYRR